MIYTVTFNPALDYVISVDHFTPGKINRTVAENMICGGKGINVSALLANLGYESTALSNVSEYIKVKIETDVDKAQKSAVLNLEKDFNDPAFDQIPEEARKSLVKALKNAGIELLDKKEINYDADGFSDGEKPVRRHFCVGVLF